MKTLSIKLLGLALFTFVLIGCNTDSSVITPESETDLLKSGQQDFNSADAVLYSTSPEEIAGLIHMRIEEKLARDVYDALWKKWNAKVFLNIKLSEQAHTEAVKRMLNKYSIPDPIVTDVAGVFPDPAFQALYDQLVLQGSATIEEAYKVGVAIEELDIKDLEEQLTIVVDSPDIIRLYTNLKAGSVSHLAAFNRNVIGCVALAVD